MLGQALKQSLKTGDARVAKARAAEVNAKYEEIVTKAKQGQVVEKPAPVAVTPTVFSPVVIIGRTSVKELARRYLNRRSGELQYGGFKSVKYSVGLFASAFGSKPIGAVTRDDALAFVRKVALLGKYTGRSFRTRGFSLEQRVQATSGATTSARTQRRTVSQVGHFLDWAVYEGELGANPFSTVRVETKGKNQSYAVLTDEEVKELLALEDPRIDDVFRFCLLSGMRAGEAVGLVREDLVWKGNLGWFALIQPNEVRSLKTDAATRQVPLHSSLTGVLERLPKQGRLFPNLKVAIVTKRFALKKAAADITRPGVVFHSTRKWFVTQCERAGVPEHFTASIVGHQSARSENRMTYGIYSAGISDEQKRQIVEKVGLPCP